jgi:hypothetical protein
MTGTGEQRGVVHVEVTQADIDAGEPGNCVTCPVALAARRALSVLGGVVVFDDMLSWIEQGVRWAVALPPQARRWVQDFDLLGGDGYVNVPEPEPFGFEIDLRDSAFPDDVDHPWPGAGPPGAPS